MKTRRTRRRRQRKQRGSGSLNIFYGNQKVSGQEMNLSTTAREPSLTIPKGYVLWLIDPDAVGGTWVHWVADNQKTLLEYQGPSPPKGTGVHRYIFMLVKESESPSIPFERSGFDTGLLKPVSQIQFLAESVKN